MTDSPPTRRSRGPTFLKVGSILLFGAALLALSTIEPGTNVAPRLMDDSNLHTIGVIWFTYFVDRDTPMPESALADVYSLAAELARTVPGANESKYWFSRREEENGHWIPLAETVLAGNGSKTINPDFQDAPVAWAVALLPNSRKQTADTPIAWTRGLRTDGTWRDDSPFGGDGGCVFFCGGDTQIFRGKIGGKLFKWGTKEPTSNIIEALPPGTRVSEYVPNPKGMALVRQTHWPELAGERERARALLLDFAASLGVIGAILVLIGAMQQRPLD